MSKQYLDDEMISRLHDWFEIPNKPELYQAIADWLASVKADAWDEGVDVGWDARGGGDPDPVNPYRGEQA